MSSNADDPAFRQAMLDRLESALQDHPDLPPALRANAMQQFDQALKQAADNPRSPAEVLAAWNETAADWQTLVGTLQQQGEVSATDAGELFRQFDQVRQTLQDLPEADAGTAPGAQAAALPQGMPAELARAMERGRTPT
ncbi:hypothetical protein ASG87_17840 [Frateuria sp. Soil773]|uniref:hypothetical protein n=1 Tax=Frateuria sp. Soil773 TaxID=1736407 RepID=UPI0006FECBAF|nr:hypothetical protein [Frateuria sp. Soil773]KRE94464.1 hypothetical protein ASG87_17840 [Frateuria sp. Soil773]